MKRYVVLNKKVGETPLSCMEAWRVQQSAVYQDIPLTYAGRLDPLASGQLLVLIGEECKRKEQYLKLDKAYDFTLLLGISTDSGDVLGLVSQTSPTVVEKKALAAACKTLTGNITLPYPAFSSKPVQGKPLHTWAVEGRLHEITIPTVTSQLYALRCEHTETITRQQVYDRALQKINSIPPVTEQRKALGNDFRRDEIRAKWQTWLENTQEDTFYTLAHCHVRCSSGTYVRSLASAIAEQCGTNALAWTIHRTHIGHYRTFGPLYYWSLSV